jgi:sugar transferase EpsL
MVFILNRLFNIGLASVLLVLTAPLFLLCMFVLFLEIGYPVFFYQKRIGHNGKLFSIIKLRTMIKNADGNENFFEKTRKSTRLIRRLSIDELPQLVNVLKGDMNIVGPRPLLPEYREIFSAEEFRRHEVKPGITGWAQINGRNSIEWDEKLKLDVWYVGNRSFLLDLRIILFTPFAIFFKGGVNSSDCETMPNLKKKRVST